MGFGREIVTSKARYFCKLLRVSLKLFFLNTSYLFLVSVFATLGKVTTLSRGRNILGARPE